MVNRNVTAQSSKTTVLPVEKKTKGIRIKILLVDDSNSVREEIEQYLATQSDFTVVGSVDNARMALEKIKVLNPHIVLMDIEMLGIDGIETTRAIAEKFPQTKVIVFSSHNDEQSVNRVLNAGAKSYLLKIPPWKN